VRFTITLTLPEGGASEEATLLIQRGSFAHLTTFTYLSLADVTAALQEAQRQLTALEASPPILPAVVSATPTAATRSASVKPASAAKATDSLTIPVGKKTRQIPSHHLHAPSDQQAQAITIAGRLLAGGLWDGLSPIHITDAARTLKALKPLSDKDLTLFSLTDFVEVGPPDVLPEVDDGEDTDEIQANDTPPMTWQVGDTVPLVPEAVDEDGEPVPFDVGHIVEIDAGDAGPRLWLESPDGDHDVWVSCDQLAAV